MDNLPGYSRYLITMLKLDRYTTGTISPPPDGLFDWRPGITIIPNTGDILFPSLEPFSDGLRQAGVNDSTYQFSEIYTQIKVSTQTSPKAAMYFLRGKTIQLK
jgi:cell surface protein SprA